MAWFVVLGMATLFLVGLAIDWVRKVLGRLEALEARVDVMTEVLGKCVRDIQDMGADGHLAKYAYTEEGEEDGSQATGED